MFKYPLFEQIFFKQVRESVPHLFIQFSFHYILIVSSFTMDSAEHTCYTFLSDTYIQHSPRNHSHSFLLEIYIYIFFDSFLS